MSRILRLMALCCAALCSQMTFAQPRVIGIDELFRLAEEQSMSIRSFESGAAAAAEGVRAARAERLPDVGVTVSASFLGDGRLWDRSFGEGMKVDIPHFGNNFALEAQQVVYAGGAVRSGIRMAELEQRDAETSLERNRQDICFLLLGHYLNLYKADNRIRVLRENLALTEQVLETMRARREQGTVLQNEAAIRLAEAAVELARLNLSYTVIVAPCDGVTGRRQIDEGQLVQPGQTLLDVVDSGEVWVTANYRETQLPHIAVGADVEMTVDAVPDVTYHGVVESVSDATGAAFSLIPQDNATGNFVKVEQRVPVRIRLEGNDAEAMSQLRAGLNVECKVRY